MKYTETHEWIQVQDQIGTVGISEYAQKELGDIVYVEFPKVGKEIKAGDEVCVLESTKAAADVYSPVSGIIQEINPNLKQDSGLINTSAEKEGWIYKIKLSRPDEIEKLMERAKYLQLVSKK